MWMLRWNATPGRVGKVRRPAAAGRTNLRSGLRSRSELKDGLVAPRRIDFANAPRRLRGATACQGRSRSTLAVPRLLIARRFEGEDNANRFVLARSVINMPSLY